MRSSKLLVPSVILLGGFALCTTSSLYGNPDYSKKAKKSCTFCHTKMVTDKAEMAKNLNPVGTCYKDNEHSLAKCDAAKK